MAECKCGYTTDKENKCNGTHKAVKALREQIIKDIESIVVGEDNNQLNAFGMKMLAINAVKGKS